MFRKVLRVLACLLLIGGLISSAIAGYLLVTPSDEEKLYEQKYKEAEEKFEKARATTDPAEKQRLTEEAKDAADWAQAWGEGARLRKGSNQLGMYAGVGVLFFGLVLLVLTFVGRKPTPAPA
jgi:hypothetical protein